MASEIRTSAGIIIKDTGAGADGGCTHFATQNNAEIDFNFKSKTCFKLLIEIISETHFSIKCAEE